MLITTQFPQVKELTPQNHLLQTEIAYTKTLFPDAASYTDVYEHMGVVRLSQCSVAVIPGSLTHHPLLHSFARTPYSHIVCTWRSLSLTSSRKGTLAFLIVQRE